MHLVVHYKQNLRYLGDGSRSVGTFVCAVGNLTHTLGGACECFVTFCTARNWLYFLLYSLTNFLAQAHVSGSETPPGTKLNVSIYSFPGRGTSGRRSSELNCVGKNSTVSIWIWYLRFNFGCSPRPKSLNAFHVFYRSIISFNWNGTKRKGPVLCKYV